MSDQQKYTNKLRDAHVLVIGGSAGIGYGVAEASLEHGAKVTISSSNPTRVKDAVAKLKQAYPSAADKVSGEVCALGDEEAIDENVKNLFEKIGRVNHVVYTAGDRLGTMDVREITVAKAKQAGMVRFFAPLIVARHAAARLPRDPSSSYTITTGAVAERPNLNWIVVGAFAGGLVTMARGLALDLAPIRVNAISPGAVDTELWDSMTEEQKKVMRERLTAGSTTGRIGRVEDVAEAYLYVMRDANVTGSVVSTNSGVLLK